GCKNPLHAASLTLRPELVEGMPFFFAPVRLELPPVDASAPILLFDSGVGGLSVLAELRKLLPEAPVIYAADNAGLPYGAKTEAQVAARVAGLPGRMT